MFLPLCGEKCKIHLSSARLPCLCESQCVLDFMKKEEIVFKLHIVEALTAEKPISFIRQSIHSSFRLHFHAMFLFLNKFLIFM